MNIPPDLQIDKDGSVPVYRQIIEKITRLVKEERLKPGDRIPPERELAQAAGIARGTISKAYQELERNGIIESNQGRGSFVAGLSAPASEGRKVRAMELIDTMLSGMVDLDFSYNEIRNFVHIMIMERESKLRNFHFAAVDCNPEALSIYESQLLYVTSARLNTYLLEDVRKMEQPEKTFEHYDLILTTTTHIHELGELLPSHREKIIQAAVAPSQQTIIDLASLTPADRIGIICASDIFNRIIRNRLYAFQIDPSMVETAYHARGEELDLTDFLEEKSVLILPPDLRLEEQPGFQQAMLRFTERNGRIIRFQYQIERGSLIHIEEYITTLLNG